MLKVIKMNTKKGTLSDFVCELLKKIAQDMIVYSSIISLSVVDVDTIRNIHSEEYRS